MQEDSLLSGNIHQGEELPETTLRPVYLKDFQGQEEIKENLSIFIQAAKQRRECLDHVFFSSPPGLGKTTLAGVMAHEMGSDFKVTAAPALERAKDLAGLLTTIPEGTVFFIDEIHRLKPAIEEMLYIAMEDFELDWIIGQGPSARSIRIPVPRFTLIGATTKAGQVSGPLFTRFGIHIRINFYSHQDIKRILTRSAGILDIAIEEKGLNLLSHCSRGTPRVANRLLRRMRDFAQVKGSGVITEAVVKLGLERLKIDGYGLEEQDRLILKSLIDKFNGGPVGGETLAISVGEETDSLEDFYEPYLIQSGFLKRTSRGRVATGKAYEHLKLTKKASNEDQGLLF